MYIQSIYNIYIKYILEYTKYIHENMCLLHKVYACKICVQGVYIKELCVQRVCVYI